MILICFLTKDLACTIDAVTIDGCRKDRDTGPCKLKRNVNAAINIAFTPDFDGDDITLMAYALIAGLEKSFPDMDENACNHMTCPVSNGVKQSYSFGLKLAPSYPLVSKISVNRCKILQPVLFRACST